MPYRYDDIKEDLIQTPGWGGLTVYERTRLLGMELMRRGMGWPNIKILCDIIETGNPTSIYQAVRGFRQEVRAALKPEPFYSRTKQIVLPDNMNFFDLELAKDPETGYVSFNWGPLGLIFAQNKLDILQFHSYACIIEARHTIEREINFACPKRADDNLAILIVAWYRAHRQHGGDPDPVAEAWLAEAPKADEAVGEFSSLAEAVRVSGILKSARRPINPPMNNKEHPWRKWG
jgi:hypothetical protein